MPREWGESAIPKWTPRRMDFHASAGSVGENDMWTWNGDTEVEESLGDEGIEREKAYSFDRKPTELKVLLDFTRDISSILNLDELLQTILLKIERVFGHRHSMIQLVDLGSQELTPLAYRGFPPEVAECRIRLGEGIIGMAALTGKPIRIPNLHKGNGYPPGIEDARSALALPLIAKDKTIGVLNIESHHLDAFSPEEETLLTILAGQIAIAIENARLYEQAVESKSKLEGVFNTITDNISLLSPGYDILMVNEATAQRYDTTQQELLGKKCFQAYRQQKGPCGDCPIPSAMESKSPAWAEIKAPTMIGEIIQMYAYPLLDEAGEVTGIIEYGRIITELKRLEEELIRSERLAALAEMAGSIWHELNNYLSVVLVRIQLLLNILENKPDREKALANAKIIHDTAQKMIKFTRGLMDLSRKDTYKRACSLNEIIEKTIELLQPQNKFDNIRFILQLDRNFPFISLDPDQIQQVLINLFNNAAEAMERGEIVVISRTGSSDGALELSVSDNGPGIPEEIRKKIFEPHFSTKREGHGFGLATCYRIIKNHNGEMEVESEMGKGTKFTLRLPGSAAERGWTPGLIHQRASLAELRNGN